MLVRRIARPLFAGVFVAEGLDALRRPGPHADRAQAAWSQVAARTDLPGPPDRSQLKSLARVHGAATALAAFMLAVGRAPRTAALVLAALTVPRAIVDQPFGTIGRLTATASAAAEKHDRDDATQSSGARGGRSTRRSATDRSELRARFLRSLSMIGGALLAAIDTEGRPGVTWRVKHARVDRATARHAKADLAATARRAKSSAREVRRQVRS